MHGGWGNERGRHRNPMRYICPECGTRYNLRGHTDQCSRGKGGIKSAAILIITSSGTFIQGDGKTVRKVVSKFLFWPVNIVQYFCDDGCSFAYVGDILIRVK